MKKIKDLISENINKFSFAQATSNSTGKTSGSGSAGIYIVFFGVLAFLYGVWEFHGSGKNDIMMYSTANIAVGAGLLGYRKSKEGNDVLNIPDASEAPEIKDAPEPQEVAK